MDVPFDVSNKILRSYKEGFRVVPLQSSTNIKKNVSTNTNQKSIKKITTVTTSRHAGQRVINKNTRTTTTDTNTQGLVVLGQPSQECAPILSTQQNALHLSSQQRSSKQSLMGNKTYEKSSFEQRKVDKTKSFPVNPTQTIENRTLEPQKYKSQNKCKELNAIHQKGLVGMLSRMFEHDNARTLSSRESCPNKTNIRNRGILNITGDAIKNLDQTADTVGTLCYGEESRRKVAENDFDTQMKDKTKMDFIKPQKGYSLESKNNILPQNNMIKATSKENRRYDNTYHLTDTNINLSKEPSHMKTYTFSIPKTSLFQVSSKQLRSILESPDELSSAAANPSVIFETFTSGEPTAPSFGSDALGCQNDTENSCNLNDGIKKDTHILSANKQRPVLHKSSYYGLDYSRIWEPISRDVEVRPARRVTCYKDYLTM